MADFWRIEPTSTKRPVRLTLGGTEFCLTVEEAMALVAGAPRMARGWSPPAPVAGCGAMRADINGRTVAVVFGALNVDGTHEWACYDPTPKVGSLSAGPTARGRTDSLAEAQQAADSALVAAGYVLGGGEGG